MMGLIEFRDPALIEDELEDIEELLTLNQDLLSRLQDEEDPALEFNLEYLQDVKKALEVELKESYDYYDVDTIPVVIKKDNPSEIPPLMDTIAISNNIQEIIPSFAQAYIDPVKWGDKIKPEIRQATTLKLIKARAGSLRMVLRTDPLETESQKKIVTHVRTAIDNLSNLISCGDDVELLKKQAKRLGPKNMDKYKDLLDTITTHEVDLTLFDYGEFNGIKKQKITRKSAESIYQIVTSSNPVKEDTIIIEGELGLINTFDNKFTIKDSKNQKYSIKFDEHFTEQVRSHLKEIVKVEIDISIKYHEMIDKEDKENTLKRFIDN